MKQLIKLLLIIIGSVSLVLGVLGIFLPLLPTTPLLLLATACYIRSSEKLYHWLITHKILGSYIQSFRSGKDIPIRAKIIAIAMVWLSFGFSAIFVVETFLLKFLFIFGAVFWTVLMLSIKALRKPTDNGKTKQPG